MRVKSWFLFIIVVLLTTACGPAIRSVSGVSTDIVIIYQREGGFAGTSQEWVIHPDGSIEAPGERELAADPDDTSALLALTTDDEISDLGDSYVPQDDCCDKYFYTITIKVGDQEKTIRSSDGADQPEELTDLLAAIEELIAKAASVE